MISTILFIVGANLSAGQLHAGVPQHSQAEIVDIDLQLVQSRTLEDVIFQLQTAGYEVEDITRTFLGRLRVVAKIDGTRREIIMSRSTGEILSDTVSVIRTTPAGEVGSTDPGGVNRGSRTPAENANPRDNDRGGNSGGAANNNRGGDNAASSNRGSGGNKNSNARPGSD